MGSCVSAGDVEKPCYDQTKHGTSQTKAVADERPSKKSRSTNDSSQKDDSSERKPVAKSVLLQEDRAFPRGGGSVLTPVEQKQIKVQAERDALFEQRTGQKASTENGVEDADLFDQRAGKKGKKNGIGNKSRQGDGDVAGMPKATKISGLSYKALEVGSIVLGQVTAITGRDIAIALPNNLTGFAPITAVSEVVNARIEKMLKEEEVDGADASDDEDVDLKSMFHKGQWLRAVVTSSGSDVEEPSGKNKRHIELSVDPRHVNASLDADSVVQNSMIQASVRSVEDHGVIMNLGLADPDVRGFVSKKELGAAFEIDDVEQGQVMLCLVTGKGSNGQVLKLAGCCSILGDRRRQDWTFRDRRPDS